MYKRIGIFTVFFLLLVGTPRLKAEMNEWGNELRFGVLQHDANRKLKHRYEKGQDINGEALFKSPDFLKFIWAPRPHLGLNANLHGATSQFYGGLTWHVDFLRAFFLEASFGGEVHNGKLKTRTPKKQHLGSRFLFRESLSLGVAFYNRNSLSLTLEHASNARLAKPNPGLTGFGLRYGYRF